MLEKNDLLASFSSLCRGLGEVVAQVGNSILVGCPPVGWGWGWGEGRLPSGGHFLNLSGNNASVSSSLRPESLMSLAGCLLQGCPQRGGTQLGVREQG